MNKKRPFLNGRFPMQWNFGNLVLPKSYLSFIYGEFGIISVVIVGSGRIWH